MIGSTILALAGFAYAFGVYTIGSTHPTPSQTNLGTHFIVGLILGVCGLLGVVISWFGG